jgi:hypothetical protein
MWAFIFKVLVMIYSFLNYHDPFGLLVVQYNRILIDV